MTAALPLTLDYPLDAPPAPGAALTIAPGILWLRMPLPFALDHINVWLLSDGDDWTLVDCGFGTAPTRELWATHFSSTLDGRPIGRVIATHCHPDHVGNAEWLVARFGCPLFMTHAEFMTVHAMAEQHSGYGVQHTIALFRQHGMEDDHLAALDDRGNAYRRGVPTTPLNFERLLDGDRLAVDGHDWEVIEGHGHSPEHASLYSGSHGVLISGDMLLPRISTNISIWAVEPDGDPLQRFLDSLARFEALPPDTLVLPSHGMPFRGIALRVAELRAHHAARLRELEAAVHATGPSSAATIVPVLFRRELDLQQRFFAMGEAIAHLNHLWRRGRLKRVRTSDNRILYAPTA